MIYKKTAVLLRQIMVPAPLQQPRRQPLLLCVFYPDPDADDDGCRENEQQYQRRQRSGKTEEQVLCAAHKLRPPVGKGNFKLFSK